MQKLFQSISADAGYRMEVVLKKTIEISASKDFSKKELFMAFRRLSKDYEITTSSAETIIFIGSFYHDRRVLSHINSCSMH